MNAASPCSKSSGRGRSWPSSAWRGKCASGTTSSRVACAAGTAGSFLSCPPPPHPHRRGVAGQVRKRYYFEPGGVRSGHGGYLLKLPLSLNAQWTGDDGQVRVTAVDQSVTVPAGTFSNCLQTVEQAQLGSATRKTSTLFCPGVGITVLEIEANEGSTSISQQLRLKSFGPRFSGS